MLKLLIFVSLINWVALEALLSDDLHYFETLKTVDLNRRVRRSADPHPSSHLHEIWFSSLGRHFHLYVKQTKVVSDNFKVNIVNDKGEKTSIDLDTGNFYTGTLKDDLSSEVQLHWEGDDLHANIKSADEIFYIEPSWRHLGKSDNHSMIVYKHSDLKWKPEKVTTKKRNDGFCTMKDLRKKEENFDDNVKLFHQNDDNAQTGHSRKKRQVFPHVGTHTMCRLFVVADYYFFKEIGGGDKRITGEYLIGIMGRVNSIYQKTMWGEGITNLGFEIQEMLIHDSYDRRGGDHYNMEDRPNDMDKVLDWFGADDTKLTGFCLGHLFTYQQFPGKLGLAYVGSWRFSDPGGICSYAAYVGSGKKIAVNTGVSTFQNPNGGRALAARGLITVSHELGHNWGSEHDPDNAECAPSTTHNGKYIMFYMATSGYDPNNQIFSPCSKRFIYKVVMKKGYECFKEPTSGGRGLCGNGRKDVGEECDGGYEGDLCCQPDCKLRSGAQCSSMNFACCANCGMAPAGTRCYGSEVEELDCKGPTNCTGYSYTCPEPSKLSNVPCIDGGTCRDGECLDQCTTAGKQNCICLGNDACKRCCINDAGVCAPLVGADFHQIGRPCEGGFCINGACVESDPPVIKRLFSILEYFSVDKIALFMKNNLVWTILLFSSILWIIGIIIIEIHDRKEAKKDNKVVEMMDPQRGGRKVIIREDLAIDYIGARALKPRIRRGKGRAVLEEEDLAREAGF